VLLHGVPNSIVLDRDTRFQSGFWQTLQAAFGMLLCFSTAFYPAMDGQTEHTIQLLEDMLRAYALDFKKAWDEHLALIEFFYNNSYRASIRIAPYEALYRSRCRTPLCWQEIEEALTIGSDLIQATTDNPRTNEGLLSRQKSYADRRHWPLEFQVGDKVFFKFPQPTESRDFV